MERRGNIGDGGERASRARQTERDDTVAGKYPLPTSKNVDRGDDPTEDNLPIGRASQSAPKLPKDPTERINVVRRSPATPRTPAREPDGTPYAAKNSSYGTNTNRGADRTTIINSNQGNRDLGDELMGMGGGDGGAGEFPYDDESPNDPNWFGRRKKGLAVAGVVVALVAGAKTADALGVIGSHNTASYKPLPTATGTPPKSKTTKSSSAKPTSRASSTSSSSTKASSSALATNRPTTSAPSGKKSAASKPVVVPPESNPAKKPKTNPELQCVSKIPEKAKINYTLVLGVNSGNSANDFDLIKGSDPAPKGGVSTDHVSINANAEQKAAMTGVAGVVVMKSGDDRKSQDAALKYLSKGNLNAKKVDSYNPLFMPMEVGTDQEGGTVQHYKVPNSVIPGGNLPSAEQAAKTLTPEQYQTMVEKDLSYLHKTDGINTVYGPVVDVAPADGSAAFEGSTRVYSSDPATVTKYAEAFVKGANQAGVTAVVKHFPGIGSASGNPDYGAAQDPSIDQLRTRDWKTFEALSKDTSEVMVTTAKVAGKNGWTTPADLNVHAVATARQMGYDSVITDSIGSSSGAIKALKLSVGQTVVEALQAGNNKVMLADVDIMNSSSTLKTIDSAVAQAIKSGKLSEKTLDRAVLQNLKDRGVNACTVAKAYKEAPPNTPPTGISLRPDSAKTSDAKTTKEN